jgi:hypothetical protein
MNPQKVFVLYKTDWDSAFTEIKIIAILSTEEKAQDALSLCPDSTDKVKYEYDEWNLDKILEHPEGHQAYICNVTKDLQFVDVKKFDILNMTLAAQFFPSLSYSEYSKIYTVYCWARDPKHAEELSLEMTTSHKIP